MQDLVKQLSQKLQAGSLFLTTAESCTGGWIAKTLTDLAGSSAWFERGFVTYSNAAKCEMLGVAPELIEQFGAVSREVAVAMAAGALQYSHADCSLAITGVAGPGGGSKEKPVGLVWFAFSVPGKPILAKRYHFSGDREAIRHHAAYYALDQLTQLLG